MHNNISSLMVKKWAKDFAKIIACFLLNHALNSKAVLGSLENIRENIKKRK